MRKWAYAALALGVALAGAWVLDRCFPPPIPDLTRSGSSVVLARDGTPLRAFPDAAGVWRYPVALEEVSPLYLEALLNYEDRWFYQHAGINPLALLRAAGQRLRHGRVVSGGSTLTMQLARIIDPHARSLPGKLKQMLRAAQLEWRLSKRDILTLYINLAPFGGTVEGVQAASWAYLGKPAVSLSHAEAALLAVLPQAPSRLRPDRHAQSAAIARDKLLARLQAFAIWSAAEVADARIEAVVSRRLRPPLSAALLAERLRHAHPERRSLLSSIDADLQRALEARVSAYLARLPARTSAALLVVDNRDMLARAYVGSAAFADPARLGHVDMVRAVRSPGSTLKPFVYGLALDDGLIHSESLLLDVPQDFSGYRPNNFDQRFNGPVAAAEALRLSLNVPAVDLLDRLSPQRFAARLRHGGLPLMLPPGAEPNLAIVLGGAGARLEDLVAAYAALNRCGLAAAVRYSNSEPLQERRLLSEGAAWIVRRVLEAHQRPGYSAGTFDYSGRAPLAWKTGTSYGFRDSWAIASSRNYSVGVWIGRPDGTPLPGHYGAITALPLLFEIADGLPQGHDGSTPRPASVSEIDICWPLGLPPDPAAPELCQQRRSAWILDGSVPPTLADRAALSWEPAVVRYRVDANSGLRLSADCRRPHSIERALARWPALAYPWLSRAARQASRLPPLAADCANGAEDAGNAFQIAGIHDGATLVRAPQALRMPSLNLRALGTEEPVLWLIDGRLAGESRGTETFQHEFAHSGRYSITALTRAGRFAQVEIQVLE